VTEKPKGTQAAACASWGKETAEGKKRKSTAGPRPKRAVLTRSALTFCLAGGSIGSQAVDDGNDPALPLTPGHSR